MAQSDSDNAPLKQVLEKVMKSYVNGVYRWNAGNNERRDGLKNFLKIFIQNASRKDFRKLGHEALQKSWKEYEKSAYFSQTAPHFIYRIISKDRFPHIYRIDSRSTFYKFNHPLVPSPVPCGYKKCSMTPGEDSVQNVISVVCTNACHMFFHSSCFYEHIKTYGVLCTLTSECYALWTSCQVFGSTPEDFLKFCKVDAAIDKLECVEGPCLIQERFEDHEDPNKQTELRICKRLQEMWPSEEFEMEAENVRDIIATKVNNANFTEIMNSEICIRVQKSPRKVVQSPSPVKSQGSRKRPAMDSSVWTTSCVIEDPPFLTINLSNSSHIDKSDASTEPIVKNSDKGTDAMEIRKKTRSTTTTRKIKGISSRYTQYNSQKTSDKSIGTNKPTSDRGTEATHVDKVDAQTETFIRSSIAVGVQTGRVEVREFLISNHQLFKMEQEFINYRYEEFNARCRLLKSAANTSLENGRIQVSLRTYLRRIIMHKDDTERWIGEVEEHCCALQTNEDFIKPLLDYSLEFLLGLFPLPPPPEMNKLLSDCIFNELIVTGFHNFNDPNNLLLLDLVKEAVIEFPIAGKDAVIWSLFHIRRRVEFLDGIDLCKVLFRVLTQFTDNVIIESRKLVVYIA
ncbi:unnamed protein product [Lepeophtheirus salmonis]|uniref:(salmon louse) hypothetical protein n=1 Tax=Lepeophtheirus salmonis TaxID=72036 RepID=A0A7R8HDX9_LEPSM|nr:unnamed protein product [Lepeophtheirus salmonis]CAF3035201.1 unnamed protein product [Lepeophtheirus salmonis]